MHTEDILKLGDRIFLMSDNIFCFGDRQTRKTWNMMLKGFLKCHERFSTDFSINEYRMVVICATIEQGRHSIDVAKKISETLGLKVIRENKYELHIDLGYGKIFKIELVSTEEQTRGKTVNFLMWDEPEYHPHKKIFFKSLMMRELDYILGGASFYPMGINPRLTSVIK